MTFGDMGNVAYDESVTNDGLDESSEDGLDEDEIHRIIDDKLGLQTPNPVDDTPPILPDVEMTPVDQPVIPENSRKKDKQKARVTDDKQIKNQSTMANPGAQTSVKKPRRGLLMRVRI